MFTSKVDVFYAFANVGWKVLQPINSALREGVLPAPKWAPGPLLKSRQRRPVELGVPRKTSSLCPDCNREAAEAVLSGENEIADFRDRPGIIDSEILEEGGRILMRKACEKYGHLKTCFRIIQPSSGWRGWLLARTPIVPAMKSFTITALTALREGGART